MQAEHELIKRIFQAQRDDPKKGDWWLMVKADLEKYGIDENELKELKKAQAKKLIKEKVYKKTFEDLKDVQKTHSKIKNIEYTEFKRQGYMNNTKMSFDEKSLLFKLRSRTVIDIKCNIKTFSQNDKMCPLCMKSEDTQEHCMECPKLKTCQNQLGNHSQYNHIFSTCELEQKAIAALFLYILETRQLLIQEGLPGALTLDPPLYL